MVKIIVHPNENPKLRMLCNHCTALLEFTVADVVRIRGVSYLTCPCCESEVSIVTAMHAAK